MVSFWDAVRDNVHPRSARGEGVYPRRFVAGIVVRQPSSVGRGEDRQRDYPSYLQTSNAVYACVNARTKALSSLPLKIYSKRLNKDGHRDEVSTGPTRDILDSVNPFWTFTRWMDTDRTGALHVGRVVHVLRNRWPWSPGGNVVGAV